MEKRMDGVRTRAVCVSGIKPLSHFLLALSVSFPPCEFVSLPAALNVMNDSDCKELDKGFIDMCASPVSAL